MSAEKVKLVFSDLKNNSYKYWQAELQDNGNMIAEYGVVGAKNPQTNDYGCVGRSFFEKKIREKEKKGYSRAKVLMEGTVTAPVNKGSLADIALSQIKLSDDSLKALVKRLADSNVHKITNSTSISFNNGVFQTPLGIVTHEGIDEARILLDYFFKNIKKNGKDDFNQNIDNYLKIIPRPKGGGLQYEDIFPDVEAVKKESDVLDALANSVDLALKPADTISDGKPQEKVFNLEMGLVTDPKIIKKITDWYNSTNKAMHHYTNVKIVNIYAVDIVDYNKNFTHDDKQIVEVWHGSGQSNILSIMKTGLFCSPPSTAAIAGKMFGNGVYGSKTASKSLGYTLGRWGQGRSESGWLFVCDFAMGKPYYPTHSGNIPQGYDSCWALPEKTGLLNDELIVYNEKRIKIKYLLEVKG